MLTAFETSVLGASGNAKELIRKYYNRDIGQNNAEKFLAGIRMHLKTMQQLDTNKQVFSQEEVSYNGDKSQTIKRDVYLTEDEKASPVSVMRKMGFDPLLWEVLNCKIISGSWEVITKDGDGNAITNPARKYSVTLTVKPLGGRLSMDMVMQAFDALAPVKVAKVDYKLGTFLLELPIMDFHLGKLAWGEETGQSDYDLKIAENLYRETVLDILSKVKPFGTPERILFPIGQDFLHFDTPSTTTTAGTSLDSDSRWQKMFCKGVELLVWSIEQLRAIAPVQILWIPGNHDTVLSYAATVGISQRYTNTEGVEVDLSPMPRKYIDYGYNLIGFSHGENEGKRLEGLMQVEAPAQWGGSVWREMHMGHFHSESTVDKNGIIFRRISSITAADAWHSEKGFIGATRRAQAFIWDKEKGLQAIINSNVRA